MCIAPGALLRDPCRSDPRGDLGRLTANGGAHVRMERVGLPGPRTRATTRARAMAGSSLSQDWSGRGGAGLTGCLAVKRGAMRSQNRETGPPARLGLQPPMQLDHATCYRALLARDARFDGRLFIGRQDDRHLLPPDLPGAHRRKPENCRFFASAAAAQAGRLPPLPALPARDLARSRGLARHLQHRLARAGADRSRRARRRRRGGARRAAGRRRAPAAPPVPPAPRRVAGRGRADAARAARQAADPRDPPADDRGRARRRLRQRAPLQRDLPAALRPPAGRAAAHGAPALAPMPAR